MTFHVVDAAAQVEVDRIPELLREVERLPQVHQSDVSNAPSHSEARVPRAKRRTAPVAVA